jgi:Ca2+-binding EF-hand superfamily protein
MPKETEDMTMTRNTVLVTLVVAMAATSTLAFAQSAGGGGGGGLGGDRPQEMTPQDAAPEVNGDAAGEAPQFRRDMRGRGGDRMMRRLDADNSGDLSLEEFADRRLGWVIEADADGDGVVSMEELTAAIEQRRQERREARMLRMFDIDGDGEITVEELQRHQEKRFALMDRNDDGVVSADEMRRGGMQRGGPRHHMRGDHMRGPGSRHGGMGWHGR